MLLLSLFVLFLIKSFESYYKYGGGARLLFINCLPSGEEPRVSENK